MKALRVEHGGPYVLAANAHSWLANLPDPTGAARKNAELWGQRPRCGRGRLRHRQPLCAGLAAGRAPADARRAGGGFCAVRAVRAGQGLDRRALPRHFQGRHGPRRPRRASRFADSRIANGRLEADHLDMPYDTIEVRKVTPAIGAEISGCRSRWSPVQPPGERAARCADGASGDLLPRSADERRPAQGVRPPVRRTFDPSPRARAEVDGPSRDPRRPMPTPRPRWRPAKSGTPTCRASPSRRWARSSTLHQTPPVGGDTAFANMYLAYETLSEPIKRLVEGFERLPHQRPPSIRAAPTSAATRSSPRRASHRAPPSGDGSEMPVHQPRLHQGHRGAEKARERRRCWRCWCATPRTSEFQCRFRWDRHSVAFWDNRCAMHRANFDYHPHVRHGHSRDDQRRPAVLSQDPARTQHVVLSVAKDLIAGRIGMRSFATLRMTALM